MPIQQSKAYDLEKRSNYLGNYRKGYDFDSSPPEREIF